MERERKRKKRKRKEIRESSICFPSGVILIVLEKLENKPE